jgi:nitroreductase
MTDQTQDIHEVLYTTRAMRRVHPTPIPADVQSRILDAAIRAPSGGNAQNWRFLLIDDKAVIGALTPLYQRVIKALWETFYAERLAEAAADPTNPESVQMFKVQRSAQDLADNFADVPLLLFGFAQHDPSGGSIYPALWSAQLAARADGVGSALTMALSMASEETLSVLGVPDGEGWHMAGCITFGYPKGRWGVATRRPAHEVSYRNKWGQPLGIEINEPLWSAQP